jgi:7-cyano-7-deazaguanine synthase
VLLSGGLDSAVLLVDEAQRGEAQPIYVGAGFAWEQAERRVISRFLSAVTAPHRVRPLAALSVDMSDVYSARHWARTGHPPSYHTPDEDVYLPGRNVMLAAKAAVFCASEGLSRMSIGTLEGNPFPDATAEFREAMSRALSLGLGHPFRIEAPYERLSKADVVRQGLRLGVPLTLTLSCMSPIDLLDSPTHCGVCSKCRERHDAFVSAGEQDPTEYHDTRFVRV